MPSGLVLLGLREALAFHSFNVQQFWSRNAFQVVENFGQINDIVAVDRAEVAEIQRLEQVALFQQNRLHTAVNLLDKRLSVRSEAVQLAQHIPHFVFQFVVSLRCRDIDQIIFESAHARVDSHVVIVQNDKQVGLLNAGVVEAFESQAAGH